MRLSRDVAEMYRKELVDRYYKKDITWKQYSELWDAIELEPYDLSAFPTLSETSKEWINKIFDKAPEINKRGNFMLRGFTRAEGAVMYVLNLTYGDYADAISFYAYNDKEMIMFEFTEGDINLQLFSDRESYEKEKATTNEWYKEERCA